MTEDLDKDNENPLPHKIDILAEDLMYVLDALDALPETHQYSWYKRITNDANRAALDLYWEDFDVKRH